MRYGRESVVGREQSAAYELMDMCARRGSSRRGKPEK